MASAIPVASPKPPEISVQAWQEAGWLPCVLTAEITAQAFTFGDLLNIGVGSVVDSGVPIESDVSISVSGARVGGGKLDAVGRRFGVRITDLG